MSFGILLVSVVVMYLGLCTAISVVMSRKKNEQALEAEVQEDYELYYLSSEERAKEEKKFSDAVAKEIADRSDLGKKIITASGKLSESGNIVLLEKLATAKEIDPDVEKSKLVELAQAVVSKQVVPAVSKTADEVYALIEPKLGSGYDHVYRAFIRAAIKMTGDRNEGRSRRVDFRSRMDLYVGEPWRAKRYAVYEKAPEYSNFQQLSADIEIQLFKNMLELTKPLDETQAGGKRRATRKTKGIKKKKTYTKRQSTSQQRKRSLQLQQ
jgi:hypothetical protein